MLELSKNKFTGGTFFGSTGKRINCDEPCLNLQYIPPFVVCIVQFVKQPLHQAELVLRKGMFGRTH